MTFTSVRKVEDALPGGENKCNVKAHQISLTRDAHKRFQEMKRACLPKLRALFYKNLTTEDFKQLKFLRYGNVDPQSKYGCLIFFYFTLLSFHTPEDFLPLPHCVVLFGKLNFIHFVNFCFSHISQFNLSIFIYIQL